jgi:hypothetical protein
MGARCRPSTRSNDVVCTRPSAASSHSAAPAIPVAPRRCVREISSSGSSETVCSAIFQLAGGQLSWFPKQQQVRAEVFPLDVA